MKATHQPGLAKLLFDSDSYPSLQEAPLGAFEVVDEPKGQKRFWFRCPGPCHSIAAIALRPVTDGSPQSWDWNGSVDAPTLQPSINHQGCWHGWLTAGEFTSC